MSFFIFNSYIKDIFQKSLIFVMSSTGNSYSTHKTSSHWPYPVSNQIKSCFSEKKTPAKQKGKSHARHVQKRYFWLQITAGTKCPLPNLLSRAKELGRDKQKISTFPLPVSVLHDDDSQHEHFLLFRDIGF